MSISPEFRHCIRPLVLFNSICATGLLEYYNEHTINIIGYIYSFFSIFAYLTLFYIHKVSWSYYIVNRPFLLQITFILHTSCYLFFHISTIVFGIFRKKEMYNVLTQLEICMRGMEELGVSRNYSKYHRYMWYMIAGAFIDVFIMGVFDFLWSTPFTNNYMLLAYSFFIEHYPFIVMSTSEVSFVYWISYIKLKFGELNAVLQDMLTTTIDSPQHKRVLRMRDSRKNNSPSRSIYQAYQMDADIKKLKKIKKLHLDLIKCVKMTNKTYGWQILISMTTAFVLLTTLLYNIYNLIFEMFSKDKIEYLSFGYWVFFFTIKIIVVSQVCTITVKEIRDFTQQLIQNPLAFTACGFFDLDRTFICNVVGTVSTYLVILIQVGSSPLKFYIDRENIMEEIL